MQTTLTLTTMIIVLKIRTPPRTNVKDTNVISAADSTIMSLNQTIIGALSKADKAIIRSAGRSKCKSPAALLRNGKFDHIHKEVLRSRPAATIILAIIMIDATILIKTKKMGIISTKTTKAIPSSSVRPLCLRKILPHTFLTKEETLGVIAK